MMALTALAETIYEAALAAADAAASASGQTVDSILPTQLQQATYSVFAYTDDLNRAEEVLSRESDLQPFVHRDGELDPAIIHPSGSSRVEFRSLITSLFVGAAQRIYYLRMDQGKTAFVRAVLENYEEMLRAGRGQPVRAYNIVAF